MIGKFILRRKTSNELKHDSNIFEIIEYNESCLIYIAKPIDGGRNIKMFEAEILYAADDAEDTKLLLIRDHIRVYNDTQTDAYNKAKRMRDAIVTLAEDF